MGEKADSLLPRGQGIHHRKAISTRQKLTKKTRKIAVKVKAIFRERFGRAAGGFSVACTGGFCVASWTKMSISPLGAVLSLLYSFASSITRLTVYAVRFFVFLLQVHAKKKIREAIFL